MIKSEMRVLTVRENTDVTDVDVVVGWNLQPAAEIVVGVREREKADVTWTRVRYNQATTGTSLTGQAAPLHFIFPFVSEV
jgi:hypothetical protein